MKNACLAGLLLASAAVDSSAAEPSHFQVFAAAGLGLGSFEATHLALGAGYSLTRHIALGADLSYSYLPLGPHARGGGNRAYWGLATVTATPLPAAKLSPYLMLGYGVGSYVDSSKRAASGQTSALGAGLQLRLNPRASLFVESRFAMMGGITAADGLHMELPVRFGFRYRPGGRKATDMTLTGADR